MARASIPTGERPAVKRKPRDERRVELLATAIDLIHEKGYESASLQDIADRLGILKGSLYYYIQSKEDLLYEVIATTHEEGLAVISKAAAVEADALHRLHTVVRAHVKHTCNNLPKVAVFLHELKSLPAPARDRIIGRGHAYQSVFRELIAAGQAEGTMRPELDGKLTALSILGSINWVYRWFQPGGSVSANRVADQLADLSVYSVGTETALAAWGADD